MLMNKFLAIFVCALGILGSAFTASATHNRAGEIQYRHVSGYTYEITIITFTKESALADRPWLKIKWGDEPSNVSDNELDSLERTYLDPDAGIDIQENRYVGTHNYGGPGTFTIVVEDPNRNGGVLNILGSVSQIFCISSTIIISPLTGQNNSVRLLNLPVQDACLYTPWVHNPAAFDPDGDLLVYSLVPCMGDNCIPLLGWDLPSDWTSDPTDSFTIDSQTGDITWDAPLFAGEYNIAIMIQEYRNGILVGNVIRDMQITVVTCNNQPPQINPEPDYCIEAGEFLQFNISASDPDGDDIDLQAYGGPMAGVLHPASFQPNTGSFTWNPQCEEVRNQPYSVVFQAVDDGYIPLADVETVNIQVVAPRVENPTAIATGNSIELNWDIHECEDIFDDFAASQVKYAIYRRADEYGFEPTECELGVPSYTGYQYIGQSEGVDNTTYTDDNVLYGGIYCYMVVTIWPDGAESYASEEFCDTIKKDIPVITKVSVDFTDLTIGQNTICWSPPTEIDTLVFPGPYQYKLYHNTAFDQPETLIYTSSISPYLVWGDTCFIHQNINTQLDTNNYHVKLFANGNDVATSSAASSIYLRAVPGDNRVTLTMTYDDPWTNIDYEIYRKAPGEPDYTLIDIATEDVYVDDSLLNNQVYCYKALARGSYFASLVPDPLWNWTQETCATPYDQTPPCPPMLVMNTDCPEIENELVWTNPNNSCTDDVTAYNIYYAPIEGQELELIATINIVEDTTYLFPAEDFNFSIAGCYAVTALDSLNLWPDGELHQNESDFSEIICIDNCPMYFLPNIFTPNGDGQNDQFVPFPYRYIDSIDLKVFNRYGTIVFESKDPAILWNGTDLKSKEVVADGAYYYVITVNTIRLSGIVEEKFSGTIQIQDGKQPDSNQ
jgi:gliding motility-associated-like protein